MERHDIFQKVPNEFEEPKDRKSKDTKTKDQINQEESMMDTNQHLFGDGYGCHGRRKGGGDTGEGFFQDAPVEERLFRHLRGIAHQMQHRADAKGGQGRILGVLLRRGKMTQRELQEHLGIQAGSLSEVLAKLEAGDLIARTPNEADRRGMEIELTAEGQRTAREREEQRRESREELFQALSQEERASLADLLGKLNEDWRSRLGKSGWGWGHGKHGGQGCHGERDQPGCHEHQGSHGLHEGHHHQVAHGHYEGHGPHENHGPYQNQDPHAPRKDQP